MNADSTSHENRIQIKGVGDSLWVTMDPSLPSTELKAIIEESFHGLRNLLIKARIIFDLQDETATSQFISEYGEYFISQYQIASIEKPGHDPKEAKNRMRRREVDDQWYHRRSDVLMLKGRVRSGQKVSAKKHLLLLGDVNPGGHVEAGGDILVLGVLKGIAIAGQPGNEDSIIFALNFSPAQVQIGGHVAAGLPPGENQGAEFAHLVNGQIIVESYLSANPYKGLPWPEIQ